MRRFPSPSALNCFALACLGAGGLAGCTPPGPTAAVVAAPTVTANSLSAKVAACEAKIRGQMAEMSLGPVAVPGLEGEIARANRSIVGVDATAYGARSSNQVDSVRVVRSKSTDTTLDYLSYELSVADSHSDAALTLELEIESLMPDSAVSLTQKLNVGEDCALQLASTKTQKIARTNGIDWVDDNATLYLDGTRQAESIRFAVPNDRPFLNVLPAFSTGHAATQHPDKGYAYVPNVGLVTGEFGAAADVPFMEFGLDLRFRGVTLDLQYQAKPLVKIFLGEDPANGASLTMVAGKKTLLLPKADYEKLRLGSSRDLDSSVRSELGKDYLRTSNSLNLITPGLPSYDHFKAYWAVTGDSGASAPGLRSLTLTENSDATTADGAGPADLASNETIQTGLPQIRAAADAIRSTAPDDRTKQIELVLRYLSDHYAYDWAMAKNNIVRPLTTEEALAPGKGVCQHYAVIFTAVARALGIPTRIVQGYLLTDGRAGAHAWVESEVRPGLWRVIEPQDKDSLKRIYTRFYFPMARATLFEDKKQSLAGLISIYASQNLTFKPRP